MLHAHTEPLQQSAAGTEEVCKVSSQEVLDRQWQEYILYFNFIILFNTLYTDRQYLKQLLVYYSKTDFLLHGVPMEAVHHKIINSK